MKDKNLIYHKESEFQKIELYNYEKSGLKLYLDGHIQFSELDEYVYHESLSVIPMLFSKKSRVLICGGGDGLLVRTLLNFPDIKEIHLVEIDGDMISMTKNNPEMRRVSEDSLYSDKVNVIVGDAWEYVFNTKEKYDVILCDFPDPNFVELSKLYSLEFYNRCYDILNESGILCAQSCFEYGLYGVIKKTLSMIFDKVMPYRSYSQSFYVSGFLMGFKGKSKQQRAFPDWTKWVDKKVFDQMTIFAEDEKLLMTTKELVNTTDNNVLYTNSYLVNKGWELNYRYSGDTVVMENPARWRAYNESPEKIVQDIANVAKNYNIVAYVPDDCENVLPVLKEAGLKSTHQLTSVFLESSLDVLGRINDLKSRLKMDESKLSLSIIKGEDMLIHDGLKSLIADYFADHKDTFFDMLELNDIFDVNAVYHYYEKEDGTPVAFNKFIHEPLYREAEITFGKGSAKENTYMILNSAALDILEHPGTKLYANIPYDKVALYVKKIGFIQERKYNVFTCRRGDVL